MESSLFSIAKFNATRVFSSSADEQLAMLHPRSKVWVAAGVVYNQCADHTQSDRK